MPSTKLTDMLNNLISEVSDRLDSASIRQLSKATGLAESGLHRAKSGPGLRLSLKSVKLLTEYFDTYNSNNMENNMTTTPTLNPTLRNNKITGDDMPLTRSEYLEDIRALEARIVELKKSAPSSYWKLWRIRVQPGRFCIQYAQTPEGAIKGMEIVMTRDYGDAWSQTSTQIDRYDSPEQAIGVISGNIFKSVPPDQGKLMLSHYLDDQLTSEKKNGIQRDHKPALQQHAELFQQFG
ncbi:MAG: hypothetical protein COA78_34325 [Blastopirellula sp.]|nr:MAG: hypothetical protein COA78_34325 [Blastopirellula sp.]